MTWRELFVRPYEEGDKYTLCNSNELDKCPLGSKCGYNPKINKISGSYLKFNPKSDDTACCSFSKVGRCRSTPPVPPEPRFSHLTPCLVDIITLETET